MVAAGPADPRRRLADHLDGGAAADGRRVFAASSAVCGDAVSPARCGRAVGQGVAEAIAAPAWIGLIALMCNDPRRHQGARPLGRSAGARRKRSSSCPGADRPGLVGWNLLHQPADRDGRAGAAARRVAESRWARTGHGWTGRRGTGPPGSSRSSYGLLRAGGHRGDPPCWPRSARGACCRGDGGRERRAHIADTAAVFANRPSVANLVSCSSWRTYRVHVHGTRSCSTC